MHKIFAFVGALMISAMAGCQNVQFDGGRPGVAGVQDCPTDGSACKCTEKRCRVLVDISNCSEGHAKVLSGAVTVAAGNQHPRINWVVNPIAGNPWVFRQGSGVVLKSSSTDPSGQFYEKSAASASGDPDPSLRASKRYHWRDVNITPAGVGKQFDYMVTLFDDDSSPTAHQCVVDPQIFNDG